ncbi:hypothetical protein P5V15_006150 [Pogonomyrmex californicus]
MLYVYRRFSRHLLFPLSLVFRISLHSYHNIVFYTNSLTTYMLKGPGAIFTDVRGSICQPRRVDRSPMACTETSNASKFYGLFMLFIILSLSLSLSLSFSCTRTFCHIKFTLVFACGAVMIRVFDESVIKVSRTTDFARCSSKLSDRRFFTSQRLMSLSHYFLKIVYLSRKQITFVKIYKENINYFSLSYISRSFVYFKYQM